MLKKITYIVAGAVTYLILSVVLVGYDNLVSHKKINVAIVEGFLERHSGSINKEDKFYNYIFTFKSGTLEGDAISQGGTLEAKSATSKKTMIEWVEHGGYSADEPELPASFRHFYDPTQEPGQRYLKDLLNNFFVSLAITNPKVDHVQWAITDQENEYNYEAGKQHFKNALEQSDPEFRKMNMAFAWRAVGQTLHLIADMGIASHVRDDAHPAIGGGTLGYGYSYDADPYEEVVYIHAQKPGIDSFMAGQVDPAVQSFSRAPNTTAKTIAEKLAAYTNSNFFSHETISGKDIKPKIHPEKTYASPKLENCVYLREPGLYTKNFGGNDVKMCKDLSYLCFLNDFRGYPYIDEQCILSQATALMPQIREAGINVIRCFIPAIQVKITRITDKAIEGTVTHKTDAEYPVEIKYNGLVQIKSQKSQNVLYEIECEGGKFSKNVDLSKFNPLEDQLIAEIECGGIRILSTPYEAAPAPKWKYVRFSFDRLPGVTVYSTQSVTKDSERTIKWTYDDFDRPGKYENGVFTSEWDTIVGSNIIKGKLTLTIDEANQKITSGRIVSDLRAPRDGENNYYTVEFNLANIPSSPTGYSISTANFGLRKADVCDKSRFFDLKFATAWGTGTSNIKNVLKSYTCDEYSILSVVLREKEW